MIKEIERECASMAVTFLRLTVSAFAICVLCNGLTKTMESVMSKTEKET